MPPHDIVLIMKFDFNDPYTQAEIHLTINESGFDRIFFNRDRKDKFLSIAWNRGPSQNVTIDEVNYKFPAQSILPLMVNQSFHFEKPEQIVAWQYNRNFYCIVDHDKEVSCVGFLFYGSAGNMFIILNAEQQKRIGLLLDVFIDEFSTVDNIQRDMLQMLLKRLIIIVTRLGKQQYLKDTSLTDDKLDVIRNYNLLVEKHYKKEHQVQYYAEQLNKSSKTLSNLFLQYNHKSPLAVIKDRVIMEAKRLLIYTNKSAKEIGYDIGFEDAAHFSNFFKKHTGISISDFRNTRSVLLEAK